MICLPDVNVWIALTSDRHVHHMAATAWLSRAQDCQLAFCRITEMAFLRLLTNVHVMGEDVLSARTAWDVYDQWRADSRVIFLPEPSGFSPHWRHVSRQISDRPNAWTDAYLAAFASQAEIRVVTFDRRFPVLDVAKVEILSTARQS